MKEIFGNPLLLNVLLGIILLILPSPLISRKEKKVEDTIEEVVTKKAKYISYKFLNDFAENLKKYKHDENIHLAYHELIDKELKKYKITLDLIDWNLKK